MCIIKAIASVIQLNIQSVCGTSEGRRRRTADAAEGGLFLLTQSPLSVSLNTHLHTHTYTQLNTLLTDMATQLLLTVPG